MTKTDLYQLRRRSVVVAGHRTSVSLEEAFWETLKTISSNQNKSINQLVTEIDSQRAGNLSSAIRVFVLDWLRAQSGVANDLEASAAATVTA